MAHLDSFKDHIQKLADKDKSVRFDINLIENGKPITVTVKGNVGGVVMVANMALAASGVDFEIPTANVLPHEIMYATVVLATPEGGLYDYVAYAGRAYEAGVELNRGRFNRGLEILERSNLEQIHIMYERGRND